MDSKAAYPAKVKVTATLDRNLVKALDEFLEKSETRSRSQLIEDVLHKWYKSKKMREIESQIEAYYLSLSNEDQEEDRPWAEVASQSAHHLWED